MVFLRTQCIKEVHIYLLTCDRSGGSEFVHKAGRQQAMLETMRLNSFELSISSYKKRSPFLIFLKLGLYLKGFLIQLSQVYEENQPSKQHSYASKSPSAAAVIPVIKLFYQYTSISYTGKSIPLPWSHPDFKGIVRQPKVVLLFHELPLLGVSPLRKLLRVDNSQEGLGNTRDTVDLRRFMGFGSQTHGISSPYLPSERMQKILYKKQLLVSPWE